MPTEAGLLQGISSSDANRFLGIPYAAPPIGVRRWLPPQPAAPWKGLFRANKFGPSCPQINGAGGINGSEDCLTLNVFAPGYGRIDLRKGPLPVMVWVHGGGFNSGGSDFFDPTPIVKRGDAIVVTLNYRLGPLGFLAHPAIDSENHLAGNYGIMDQQAALRWVKRNIAAFGGDPKRVTLSGHSAGGQSVQVHLTSPLSAGLFHRAVLDSAPLSAYPRLADMQPMGVDFANFAGCPEQTASCLRSAPVANLLYAQGLSTPMIDGTLLGADPMEDVATGRVNRVPVIIGTTHDEYRNFVAQIYDYSGRQLLDENYATELAAIAGEDVNSDFIQQLLALYPLSNYSVPAGAQRAPLALGALLTDGFFVCPSRAFTRVLSSQVPTFAYEFNDANAPLEQTVVPPSFPMGAYHFSQVQYFFDFYYQPGQSTHAPFTTAQQQLSNTMISHWVAFLKNGTPNASGLASWRNYQATSDLFLSLIPPSPVVKTDFDVDHRCSAFWDPPTP